EGERGSRGRGRRQEIDFALRSAIFKGDVLAPHVAIIAQALPEVMPYRGIFITNDADARNPAPRRLGASRERPRHSRAAEERDELAASHVQHRASFPALPLPVS